VCVCMCMCAFTIHSQSTQTVLVRVCLDQSHPNRRSPYESHISSRSRPPVGVEHQRDTRVRDKEKEHTYERDIARERERALYTT